MNDELKSETKKIFRIVNTLANQILDDTFPAHEIDIADYIMLKYHVSIYEVHWIALLLDVLMRANLEYLKKNEQDLKL